MKFRDGSEASPSLLIHDCAGVPPQSDSISPIGTCSDWCRCRPKKYSTAEKRGIVPGAQTSHFASTSAAGWSATAFLTWNKRISG